MLRKTLMLAGIGAAALGIGGSAQAATIVWSTPTSFVVHPVPCDVSGSARPCAFSASGSFTPPAGATKVMATFYTSAISPSSGLYSAGFDTDFGSASISGSPMTISSPDGGVTEYATTTGWVPLSSNVVAISGLSGGDSYIYGDLTFASPEPAAWALMLLGFGAIGSAIRRRRGTQVRAQLAMA